METTIQELIYPAKVVKNRELTNAPFLFNPGMTHAVIVSTPDGERIVNYCSADYTMIHNSDVIIKVGEALQALNLDYEIKFKINNFARFFIDFNVPKFRTEIMPGDAIIPRLQVINSYDGSIRFQAQFGIFRLVCSNGATVPILNVKTDKWMHMPYVLDGAPIKETIEKFQIFCDMLEEKSEPFRDMVRETIHNKEEVIDEIIRFTNFPKRQAENVLDRLNLEMAQLHSEANAWLLYNAFNYQLNHSPEIGMKEQKKNDLDMAVLDYIMDL